MAANFIQTTWGTFSTKFAQFQHLPFGTEFRLHDSQGRRRRSDMLVKRRRISSKTMSRMDDGENVKALLDSASGMLSMDLQARRWTIRLHGPTGEPLNGNTKVRTVRALHGIPTQDEIDEAEAQRLLIDELQSTAYASIVEAEHLVEDPALSVCAGYVRALVERYGFRAVEEALRSR